VIAPDGCAVLFSDGLSEAVNAGGEPFGRGGVSEAIREPSDDARDILEAVLAALRSFTGRSREEQADDITIIVLKRLPHQADRMPQPGLSRLRSARFRGESAPMGKLWISTSGSAAYSC